jgi:murein DD-endopeptidase MepM/ murein hydrolase activator NlpD
MRFFCSLLLIVVFLGCSLCSMAQGSGDFKSIAWSPSQLASGSPCLFTVEFQTPPVALRGEWFQREVDFFPSHEKTVWYALAGADVETNPGMYTFTLHATMADGKSVDATREISIGPAHYRQVELRVPEKFVAPDAEALKRIAADKEIKDHAFAHSAAMPLWQGDFLPPVKAAATDSFGTRRVFNGKLASVHRGMDFRAASGTPVLAANAGEVVLARSLFYEGNCVVIDHGQGFMTIYMHLSKIQVAEGEKVRMHQLLGLSGATGRATGLHLHFAARWQGGYLDPALLFKMKLPVNP